MYSQQQHQQQQQQQGNYPPQQQAPGCGCNSAPADQSGAQPSPCPMCCPEDPNEHFCNTDPNQQGQNGQPPSSLVCLWQQCDATTWLVLLWTVLSIIGFAITVAMKGPDNLLGHFGVSSTVALETEIAPLIDFGAPAPVVTEPPTTTAASGNETTAAPTSTEAPAAANGTSSSMGMCSAAMTARTECFSEAGLFGTFGSLCVEDVMSPTAMLMNQSRWINFRGTLYFLAMLCSLMLLVIIVIVNKQKAFLDAGGAQQAQGQYGAPVSPPYDFHGTPLYYSFRMAWGAVSVIVFFWIVTEMYQYWWFIDYYKSRTTGKLHDFWVGFDKKFVPATICVAIFLCWPIAHLCIELAFFIVGFIPWWGIKQVYVQLQMPSIDEEKPFDGHSCCIRTNMFYSDFHQAHRLGCSEGQWKMLTGSKEPFCRALECAPAQPYGMAGQPGQMNVAGARPQYPNNAFRMNGETPPPRDPESSSKKKKKKKRYDSNSDDSDSSVEVRRSHSKKSKKRSPSPSTDVNGSQSGMARGFPPSTAVSTSFSNQGGFLPPGGSSPTLGAQQSGGWTSDQDVRRSSSKKKKKHHDSDSDSERERRRAERKAEKKARRSQSGAFSPDDDVRHSKKEKKKKKRKDGE